MFPVEDGLQEDSVGLRKVLGASEEGWPDIEAVGMRFMGACAKD